MSALYGRLQGNRGEATRCGSDYLTTSAETWDGSVRVGLRREGDYTVNVGAKWGGPCVAEGNCNDGTIFLYGQALADAVNRVAESLEAALPPGVVVGEEERRIIREALAQPAPVIADA